MAKDPAFLFYPGDYLRDTQNLSEKSQVAYDRIMCEHMRNICEDMNNITISKKQLTFFTKRLSDDEKEELMFILIKKECGFQIEWVALSMSERKAYSNSRAKNRSVNPEKHMKTYDEHMEDENEDEDESKKTKRKGFKKPTIQEIKEYCIERKNKIDAEHFFDTNESKGWLVGKTRTPMKDWKATIRTWEKNNYQNDQPKKPPEKPYEQLKPPSKEDQEKVRKLMRETANNLQAAPERNHEINQPGHLV